MRHFFGDNIEPHCEYCSEGFSSAAGKNVLCRRRGVVEPGYACSKFRYDPLKRVPKRSAPMMQFDPEEFAL